MSEVKRFRKRPLVIEAMRFDGTNQNDVIGWCPDAFSPKVVGLPMPSDALWIKTLEGGHIASPGDWIVKGIKGEFYPIKPHILADSYDPED